MCMRMQKNVSPSFLQMWPCDEPDINFNSSDTATPTIKYNMTTGQLQSISSDSDHIQCLTPFGYNMANNAAAGLVLQECVENKENRDLHVKQRFHISSSQGSTKSRVLTGVQTTMCLALKLTAPLNANTMQMWAKSLPVEDEIDFSNDINSNLNDAKMNKKRVAVFIINSDVENKHSMLINNQVLAKIFQTRLVSKGVIKIKDIWKASQPFNANGEVFDGSDANIGVKEKFVDQYFSWSVQVLPRDSKFFIMELTYKN